MASSGEEPRSSSPSRAGPGTEPDAAQLDTGEDFEVLEDEEEEEDLSELPPLEDVGRPAPREDTQPSEPGRGNAAEDPQEWLDVLGESLGKESARHVEPDRLPRGSAGAPCTVTAMRSLASCPVPRSFHCSEFWATVLNPRGPVAGGTGRGGSGAAALCPSLRRSPDIPPNATLSLEVELLAAQDAPDLELLSGKEKIKLANRKRERGNFFYQQADYVLAINSYDIALKVIGSSSKVDFSPEEEAELLDVKVKCLNNLAASQLKLDHYEAALKSCNLVLEHQPGNIKALFRKGKVLAQQGEYREAIPILKAALKLEPSNK
ncbi:FKBP8 isomerase, partial [Piaya cayana]|nr:FKBP8 isomerase [Piaya cayana]